MMRLVKCLLFVGLIAASTKLEAQISVDELEFEAKTTQNAYKAKNKNYAYIRSKRGSGGVNKNDKADSVATLAINEIVLVFTELDANDKASRAEANRERWENLIKTYPEYFDYSPVLTNLCQCNPNGDTVAYKKVQGFYVYFEGDEPVADEPVVEEKAPEKVAETKSAEKKQEEKKAEPAREEKKNNDAAVGVAATGVAVGAGTNDKKKEKEEKKAEEPVAETKKENKKAKEEPVAKEETREEVEEVVEKEVAKAPVKKKTGFSKPRRAKDPKACRPPCYESGDDALNTFFAENMVLSKKQKRKFKSATSTARLMLNFDGSIKKVMVVGPNEDLNKMVQEAVGRMNLWNPAVKNGVTVKSDVKITLKYDKETKSMKPSDVIITPRPAPKCKCVSDAEMFGSN